MKPENIFVIPNAVDTKVIEIYSNIKTMCLERKIATRVYAYSGVRVISSRTLHEISC